MDALRPALVSLLLLNACGGELDPLQDAGAQNQQDTGTQSQADMGQSTVDAGVASDASVNRSELAFGQEVHDFAPGSGAGYGQDKYPEIVLGPPMGKGNEAGSLDVLSLGVGGEIVLSFADRTIIDGPGADFLVFENAFWVQGNPEVVFYELGQVSVSTDAMTWHDFHCPKEQMPPTPGCAGYTPTLVFDPQLSPLDPALTGGDSFDLMEVGLSEASYVKIKDLSTEGQEPSAGFDLDAIGLINYRQ